MTALRVLTIDDEPLALRRLAILLRSFLNVESVGEATGVRDALSKIEQLAPDLVLLDLKMRDGSGFDVIDGLAKASHPPAVIVVTAYDRFAVRAFDTIAADYLLKPVERDRLHRSLERARARLAEQDANDRVAELHGIIRDLRNEAQDADSRGARELWVKHHSGLVRVPIESIDWITSEGEYVRLETACGSYLMRGSIRQLEQRLDSSAFVRVHRRHLARKAAISAIDVSAGGRASILMSKGTKLPVGRVYGTRLRDRLDI